MDKKIIHCPICGSPCGNEHTLKVHVKARHDMEIVSVTEIESEIQEHEDQPFKEGEWVEIENVDGVTFNAFVVKPYQKHCKLEVLGPGYTALNSYMPIRGSFVNQYIRQSSDQLSPEDEDLLIDLTLFLGQPKWFKELADKKRVRS